MRRHNFPRPQYRHGHNRCILLLGCAKPARLKLSHLARRAAGALREDDEREAILHNGHHLTVRLHLSASVHASQGDVARHFHRPAHNGQLEDLCLGHVLDTAAQVGKRVDVQVG